MSRTLTVWAVVGVLGWSAWADLRPILAAREAPGAKTPLARSTDPLWIGDATIVEADGVLVLTPSNSERTLTIDVPLRDEAETFQGWAEVSYDTADRTWSIEVTDLDTDEIVAWQISASAPTSVDSEITRLEFVRDFFVYPDGDEMEDTIATTSTTCPTGMKCCTAGECSATCGTNEKPVCSKTGPDCRATCVPLKTN